MCEKGVQSEEGDEVGERVNEGLDNTESDDESAQMVTNECRE